MCRAVTLHLLDDRPGADASWLAQIPGGDQAGDAGGQVCQDKHWHRAQVPLAHLPAELLLQGLVLGQQEAVGAQDRFGLTGAPTGECEQRRRLLSGRKDLCLWLHVGRARPGDGARQVRADHKQVRNTAQRRREQAQALRPGTANECTGRKECAAARNLPRSHRWVKEHGHQSQAKERNQRDVEFKRHRLEDKDPVTRLQARLPQKRCGLRYLPLQFAKTGHAVMPANAIDDGRLAQPGPRLH